MRNRRSLGDTIGIVCGVIAIGITAFAFIYLVWIQPFYKVSSYHGFLSDFGAMGWEREENTEHVEGIFSNLTINNISGPIHIEGWDRDSIQVHYIKRARSRRALDNFPVEIKKSGSKVSIKPIYMKIFGSPFGSVSFDIKIPSSIKEINASNVSGRITINNTASGINQDLSTVSGQIETEKSGNLKAKSTSGAIDFSFTGSTLYIKTVSGQIEGSIFSLDKSGSVHIESVSGSVDVESFESLDASITLESISGSISCDFPISTSLHKKTRIEGKIGEGSIPFNVKTVSGSIQLEKSD